MGDTAAPTDSHTRPPHLDDAPRLGRRVYLTVLWRQRRFLAVMVAAGCLATLLATFLVAPTYRAASSFVAAGALTSQGGQPGLGALESVAGQFGLRLGGREGLSDLFPRILRSRTLLARVLERPLPVRDGGIDSLIAWLDPPGRSAAARRQHALGSLQDKLTADIDSRTGVVTLAVTLTDPVLAAAAANACVEELDDFLGEARRRHSSRQQAFISGRLAAVSAELAAAEEALQEFLQRNRRLADSPELALQQERLARDVEVDRKVFLELKVQQEAARIDEARDVPLIIVLDQAVPPQQKHAPRRLRLLVSSAVVFFLLGLVAVAVRDARQSIAVGTRSAP